MIVLLHIHGVDRLRLAIPLPQVLSLLVIDMTRMLGYTGCPGCAVEEYSRLNRCFLVMHRQLLSMLKV
jgi:hypothetical protein